VLVVRGAVEREPLIASAPDQPPEAAHAVALDEDQVSIAVLPLAMAVGFALKVTPGAAAATVTVADCAAVPPVPVQVNTNWVFALKATVVCEPLVASVPVQPPEAEQLDASLEFHVRTVASPLFTVDGLAVKVTAGAEEATETVTDCDALPPALVQVIV